MTPLCVSLCAVSVAAWILAFLERCAAHRTWTRDEETLAAISAATAAHQEKLVEIDRAQERIFAGGVEERRLDS